MQVTETPIWLLQSKCSFLRNISEQPYGGSWSLEIALTSSHLENPEDLDSLGFPHLDEDEIRNMTLPSCSWRFIKQRQDDATLSQSMLHLHLFKT